MGFAGLFIDLAAGGVGYRAWLETVIGGKCQVLRIETDGTAHALQHSAFKVIAQDDPGNATPCFKRQYMAEQEAVHAGVQTKVQEDAP